jgi:hypothetical protein
LVDLPPWGFAIMATIDSRSNLTFAPRNLQDVEYTRFTYNGFVSLSQVAPPPDLEAVRIILNSLFQHMGRDHGVLDHALKSAPQLKDSCVFQSCERLAKQLLGSTAAVAFDQALYKPPFEQTGTRWHQDQAFQGRYRPMNTLHFWIPLQPVTELNGCLHFMPGSHRLGLLPHYQCRADDPFALTPSHLPAMDAVCCPLQLGDATCHLPLTLHRALPNSTGSIRRAWALLFRPWGKLGVFNPVPLLQQLWRG